MPNISGDDPLQALFVQTQIRFVSLMLFGDGMASAKEDMPKSLGTLHTVSKLGQGLGDEDVMLVILKCG